MQNMHVMGGVMSWQVPHTVVISKGRRDKERERELRDMRSLYRSGAKY
jgi:hypothetical protein